MRCRGITDLASAPSAQFESEMASLGCGSRRSCTRTWEFMRSAIAEAGSIVLWRCSPGGRRRKRCRVVPSELWEEVRLRCALSEATLVLIVWVAIFPWYIRLVIHPQVASVASSGAERLFCS